MTCVAVKRCCLNSPISYQDYIFINLPSWFSVFSLFSYSFSCSCPNSEYFIYFFINLLTMIYFLYVHLFLAVVKSLCNHHMVHLPHYHTVSNSCREMEWDETLRFIYVYSHLPVSSWPWWRLLLSSRNIGQINNPSRAVWSALPSILRTTQWIGMSWLCWAIFQHFFEFGELFLHFQHPCALFWLLSRIWACFRFLGNI